MNYYQAREKRFKLPNGEWSEAGHADNIWHFTCERDGKVWPVGYCAENNCQHKTADEAWWLSD
jgi:hypothetical protein